MDRLDSAPTEFGAPVFDHEDTPASLSDYELGEELGKGGMGVVYEARQISLNRKVAIKMLPSALLAGDDVIERFRKEAEATAAIDHPNIVPVYEVGEADGQPFMAMKLVEGHPLSKRAQQLLGKPREVAELMTKVCDAVHAAHKIGILHRDLKPGNILIDAETGEPHVADFGLAKRLDEEADSQLTLTGQVLGTPGFMAPEQAAGERVSTAADVYSLGAILYQLLTGKAPFSGQNVAQVLRQIEEQPPQRPSTTTKGVDRDLEAITMKCLEKSPADRYDSAAELVEDLRRWQRREPILARQITGPQRLVRWAKRKPLNAGFAATVTLFLLTLAIAGPIVAINQARLRSEATDAQAEALAGQQLLRKQLYASELSQAGSAVSGPNGVRPIRDMLERWIPKDGETDLRGWEWHFLHGQVWPKVDLLPHGGGKALSLDFSPDKKRMVVGSDGSIRMMKAGSEEVIWEKQISGELTGRQTCVKVEFSADGRYLGVVLVGPWQLAVLDAETGETLWSERTVDRSSYFAWHPTKPILARHLRGGFIQLFDVAEDKIVNSFGTDALDGPVFFDWMGDGESLILALNDGPVLRLWMDSSRNLEPLIPPEAGLRTWSLKTSPDGRKIALGDDEGFVRLIDTTDWTFTEPVKAHIAFTWALDWSPDSRFFVSGGKDRSIPVFDAERVRLENTFQTIYPNTAGVLWHSEEQIFSWRKGEQLLRWNPVEAAPIRSGEALPLRGLSWRPDGNRLVAVNSDVVIAQASGRRRRLSAKVIPGAFSNDVLWMPDGKNIALTLNENTLAILPSFSHIRTNPIPDDVMTFQAEKGGLNREIVICQDRPWLVANGNAGIGVYNYETGETVEFFEIPESRYLACHPEKPLVAFTGGDLPWPVQLLDLESGEVTHFCDPASKQTHGLDWSRDGKRIAMAGYDGDGEVWEYPEAKRLVFLYGHTAPLTDIAISPDGNRVATSSEDATVRIWDAETGQQVLVIETEQTIVWNVEWSPDGNQLAACDQSGKVWIWRGRDG